MENDVEKLLTVEDFLKEVGRQNLQAAIGKKTTLLTRAKKTGFFPSSWFVMLRDWCEHNGHDFPSHLFNMVQAEPENETKAAD